MILRRVTEHVKDQNWFAVAIDFIIVVIGVFVGLQVSNWNTAQTAKARETALLVELRSELQASIEITRQKVSSFEQVAAAGNRSLDFIAAEAPCGNQCWDVLVDFFHASQWQRVDVQHTTYDEMRRAGLPRSREIIDAVEFYLAQNGNIASTWQEPPLYRNLVRRYIPTRAQAYYWTTCFNLIGGIETYVLDCPSGVASDVAAQAVETITSHPDIQPLLTEWIGHVHSTPTDMSNQNTAAAHAIAAIDAELDDRQ